MFNVPQFNPMFRPIQFGRKPAAISAAPVMATAAPKPADLLAELDAGLELGTDIFVRTASPETSLTALERLEARYGDLQPSSLMVLDEIQHLLQRLNLEEGWQVTLSAVKTPGRAFEEHILMEAAHDGIYDRLLKGLHELGAVRSGLEADKPDNHLQYAGVSVLLFERGLAEEQLPEAVLQVKTSRENLGRGSSTHQAAALLSDRLKEQGLTGLQVHPLELEPPAQLWALYPVTGTLARDPMQEKVIHAALKRLPESAMTENQPGFRHGQQYYPVILSPNLVNAPTSSEAPSNETLSGKLRAWLENRWRTLQSLLQRFQPNPPQTADFGDRFTLQNLH